jgi:hypothetical protein
MELDRMSIPEHDSYETAEEIAAQVLLSYTGDPADLCFGAAIRAQQYAKARAESLVYTT